jgi:hypothetical protein
MNVVLMHFFPLKSMVIIRNHIVFLSCTVHSEQSNKLKKADSLLGGGGGEGGGQSFFWPLELFTALFMQLSNY